MKKIKLFLLAFGVFASANTFAQAGSGVGRPSLSIGIDGALPVGDFKEGWKLGVGGSLKAAFPVATDFDLTLTAGYISYSGKTLGVLGKVPTLNTIPIKAGARYRFASGLYAEPQLGYTILSSKGEDSEGAFTYAANIGYMFSPQLDLGIRYEAFSKESVTFPIIGARLAYSFSL
jgi:hypothetical protein